MRAIPAKTGNRKIVCCEYGTCLPKVVLKQVCCLPCLGFLVQVGFWQQVREVFLDNPTVNVIKLFSP
jgi:hypothetical protein